MRWYWQLYCFLILGGSLLQMLRKILTETGGPSSRYAALVIAIVVIVGLVAHSQEKALGKRWMWQALFAVLCIGAALMLLFAVYLLTTRVFLPAALLLIGAVALLPALFQLYQYSYKSRSIWP